MKIPIAKEGFNLIKIFLCLTIGFWILGRAFWAPLIGLSLVWIGGIIFVIFFFRDPKREIPQGEDLILSPADGKVIEISEHSGDGKVVKIFMSPFDVHITRAPVAGRVREIKYTPGKFLPAYQRAASRVNEQNQIRIVTDHRSPITAHRVLVRQIAGVFARRIICWCKEGQNLTSGEKIGMIVFGSRVEIVVPESVGLAVKEGQRVKGGESIIASWGNADAAEKMTGIKPYATNNGGSVA